MTHNLHEFVSPFILYVNIEKAQNPAQKHFEKTNMFIYSFMPLAIPEHRSSAFIHLFF